MTAELKNEVDSIVKFVSKLFNPADVELRHVIGEFSLTPQDLIRMGLATEDPEGCVIIFYFDDIDDKYIKNPESSSIKNHKENILNREIRTYIDRYLGIKTSGLQPPESLSSWENYPISVYVMHTS